MHLSRVAVGTLTIERLSVGGVDAICRCKSFHVPAATQLYCTTVVPTAACL